MTRACWARLLPLACILVIFFSFVITQLKHCCLLNFPDCTYVVRCDIYAARCSGRCRWSQQWAGAGRRTARSPKANLDYIIKSGHVGLHSERLKNKQKTETKLIGWWSSHLPPCSSRIRTKRVTGNRDRLRCRSCFLSWAAKTAGTLQAKW